MDSKPHYDIAEDLARQEQEKEERLNKIEAELRKMQKEWINMYEKVNKLLHQ